MDTPELLRYYIKKTDKELEGINGKLDDLLLFRATLLTQAKLLSVLVSLVVTLGGMAIQFFVK